MKIRFASIPAALMVAVLCASPASADPGRDKGHDKGHDRGQTAQSRHVSHCPPGLARKDPACVPPGQARRHEARHGHRVGEVLRTGDYILVRDPRRHDLDPRPDWRYYRDENQIYRIDSDTRRVLAVLNLIDAFTN